MAVLETGHTYDIIYGRWHVDPRPHLYVLSSTGKDTFGLNLHYIVLAARGVRTQKNFAEAYKYISEGQWNSLMNILKNNQKYRPLIELINQTSEDGIYKAERKVTMKIIKNKYPWVMNAYRHYKTDYIRVRKYAGEGFV